jgi:hypothetical protein
MAGSQCQKSQSQSKLRITIVTVENPNLRELRLSLSMPRQPWQTSNMGLSTESLDPKYTMVDLMPQADQPSALLWLGLSAKSLNLSLSQE